jgi:hypothetical protein
MKFLIPFFGMAGVISVLAFALGLSFERIWPLYPAAAGVAGIYVGIRKGNRFTADFVIPSLAFLLLSSFFLLFSLDIITMRFMDFVRRFWLPLMTTCVGLAYLAVFFYKRAGTNFPKAH